MKHPAVAVLAAFALLGVFPALGSPFQVDLALQLMITAIFALSLEVLVGQTGLVSFGHAAFFGIAAYTTVLLAPGDRAGSLWVLLPAALAAAGLAAAAVGALSLRTRGVYFIMITLAFAQMAFAVVHDTPLAGGSDGITLNFRPTGALGGVARLDLQAGHALYYLTLACLAGTFALLGVMLRSRFGRALAGIRVNEQRMRAVGFPTFGYQLAAFVLAGVLAGLAGFLHAVKDGVVNPAILGWHQSGAVLLMIILGGLGHLRGALLGALAFMLLRELYQSQALFGSLARHWQLPLGLTIIACVGALPRGLIGLFEARAGSPADSRAGSRAESHPTPARSRAVDAGPGPGAAPEAERLPR
jgi:branched-chain amino acid transport system permease protein